MVDALINERIETIGNKSAYASHLRVSTTTLWRWLDKTHSPLSRNETRVKLAADTKRSETQLRKLGTIGVNQACDIVLEHIKTVDPVEEDLRDRFAAVVEEYGAGIPSTLFVIFHHRDEDQLRRQKLVGALESGMVPIAENVEDMQTALDQLPKPRT
jgi:hypothetical protein